MNNLKKLSALLLAAVVAVSVVSCSTKNSTVATVNGDKISKEEFNYYLTSVKSQIEAEQGADIPEDFWETAEIDGQIVLENAKEKALEEIVKSVIAKQKALENNVKITSEQRQQINNTLGQLVSQYGKNGVDDFLAQYGLDSKLYEKQIENSFYRANLTELLTESITEEQAKEFYTSDIVRVKHILIMTIDEMTQESLDSEGVIAAKTEAEAIMERAKNGEDFDSLVAELSQDPGSQSSPDGYYVGKGFALGMQGGMVTAFETASLELAVGDVSDVVETGYGYHIIKRYENQESAYEENQDEILALARATAFDKMLDEWKSVARIEKVDSVYNSMK